MMDSVESLEHLFAVPTDGGWGWVIVLISFYGIAIVDVPSISFQVVLPFLENLFSHPTSTVFAIFSTYTLFMHLAGPVAAGICNRFGFSFTSIVGCIGMIAGIVPLMFVESFGLFILLYGAVAGIGAGFALLVFTVIPGLWFEELKAVTLGLVSSATGLSLVTVHFSAMVSVRFGWRVCFLFWTILISILGLLSFFLWQPPMIELQGQTRRHILWAEKVAKRRVTAQDIVDTRRVRTIKWRGFFSKGLHRKLSAISESTGIPLGSASLKAPSRYTEETQNQGCCEFCRNFCLLHVISGARPFYRKDIFFQGSLIYASELEQVPSATYTLRLTKLPTARDIEEDMKCCKIPEAITRTIQDMFDFSLFKSGTFLLLVVATFFTYVAIYIPYLQIKRVNQGKMKDNHAEMLPVVMGIGLMIFRALVGFILYHLPRIGALFTLFIATIVSGLIFCAVPLSHAAPYQFILAFLGGGFPAFINPLRSVITLERLGLDRLTSCTGNLFFVQGIACFIGLPVAELLIEATGWIYSGIVFCGICYILAAFSFALIGAVNMLDQVSFGPSSIISEL